MAFKIWMTKINKYKFKNFQQKNKEQLILENSIFRSFLHKIWDFLESEKSQMGSKNPNLGPKSQKW